MFIFLPSPPVFSCATSDAWAYGTLILAGSLFILAGMFIRALAISVHEPERYLKGERLRSEEFEANGIYQSCRNPKYVGNVLMLIGLGIFANSLHFLISIVPLLAFVYHTMVTSRESDLLNTFKRPYEIYRRSVNRYLPRFGDIVHVSFGPRFTWKSYLAKEHNTIYVTCLSIYIVLMLNHPNLLMLEFHDKIYTSRIFLPTLTVAYLYLKYLEKTSRL